MVRNRIAIAYFAEIAAAEDVRRSLVVQGGDDATVSADARAGQKGACRLEVSLPPAIERLLLLLLDILLGSEALRVDIHDADPETR